MTAEQRIIKFRYWNTIINKMVNEPKMPHKENWSIEQLFSDRGWIWMQFTGLTDREGKYIFEGDIVYGESPLTSYAENPKYPILWIDALAGFNVSKDRIRVLDLKVIGNIHEDPELLEPA